MVSPYELLSTMNEEVALPGSSSSTSPQRIVLILAMGSSILHFDRLIPQESNKRLLRRLPRFTCQGFRRRISGRRGQWSLRTSCCLSMDEEAALPGPSTVDRAHQRHAPVHFLVSFLLLHSVGL
ncbi:hypothetical protein OPV22_023920 [Ensete ventricosum]|uniref:Uncharacterized protein n=1 Tax=Ensete ventricosum TaxID=4639 RepID=A0AAV8QY21_ENSVE|nr:hypothetical protein OPV22_023920 [Ensete ventricosum]